MDLLTSELERISALDILKLSENKKVLVSGGTGFVGSYIIKVFLKYNDIHVDENKYEITCLIRNQNSIERHFMPKEYERDDLNFVVENEIDKETYDYIIHAAALVSPQLYVSNPVDVYNTNVNYTQKILEIARNCNPSAFLFISSGSVYGECLSEEMDESFIGRLDFTNSATVYGVSKRIGEILCQSYLSQFGIPIKVVRPFHIYGIGMDLDDGRIFGEFIKCIVNKEDIILKTLGERKRNFCYIEDAVRAMLYVLCVGKVGEVYNVGNIYETKTIKEFANTLIHASGSNESKVKYEFMKMNNVSNGYDMIPKLTKIEKLADYSLIKKVSLLEGLERVLQSINIDSRNI